MPRRDRSAARASRAGRLKQLRAAFTLTRKHDPRMLPIVLAVGLGVLAVGIVLGIVLGHPVYGSFVAVLLALLAMTSVFARRAQRAAFGQIEGQAGAALAVVQSMRGTWHTTPMVAFNRNQDVVHRVVGRPGIILVGEGSSRGLTPLLAQERRRVTRVAADIPVYDVIVGDGDGQVPLRKLQTHLTKLPRNLKPAGVQAVEARLRPLGAPRMPIPKGPLPKNVRMPRMPRGRMR